MSALELLTIGRISVDLYAEQVGVPLPAIGPRAQFLYTQKSLKRRGKPLSAMAEHWAFAKTRYTRRKCPS